MRRATSGVTVDDDEIVGGFFVSHHQTIFCRKSPRAVITLCPKKRFEKRRFEKRGSEKRLTDERATAIFAADT
jgi:hypothetical protein